MGPSVLRNSWTAALVSSCSRIVCRADSASRCLRQVSSRSGIGSFGRESWLANVRPFLIGSWFTTAPVEAELAEILGLSTVWPEEEATACATGLDSMTFPRDLGAVKKRTAVWEYDMIISSCSTEWIPAKRKMRRGRWVRTGDAEQCGRSSGNLADSKAAWELPGQSSKVEVFPSTKWDVLEIQEKLLPLDGPFAKR